MIALGPPQSELSDDGRTQSRSLLLKLLNISKKINTPLQLASSIVFKKNKHSGKKIKKIGQKILNKTINELDNLINNEYKKT